MKHNNTTRKYAFLMVDYPFNNVMKNIQKKIKEEDLYVEEDNNDYGLEEIPHVTLVPCLDNNVELDSLKKYLMDLNDYEIVLTDITKFECEKYDVLKFSVVSDNLKKTNKEITNVFETYSEYKDKYQPHLTIAYVKRGTADKYTKKILDKLIYLKPKNFNFSFVDKDGKNKNIIFE